MKLTRLIIFFLTLISFVFPCTPEQRILKFKYRNEMKTEAGRFEVMLKLSDWNFPKSTEGVSGYNPDCRPSLTADGRYLVFHSQALNGPAYGGVSYGNGWNSYIARWNGNTWDSITNLGPVVNPASYPYISADGNKIYFDRGGDIWVTTKNDTGWDTPVRLPAPVNTTSSEDARPAISSDGSRLYFESNRTGGYGGMDIWVARWNGNSWDSVTNLGTKINTSVNESRPSLSFDGQKLYFSDFGGAARPGGYGSCDLWESVWTDSGWDYPTNVGAPVNSDLIVCSAFPQGDSLLYLGSESFDGAFGDEDIWETNLGDREQGTGTRKTKDEGRGTNLDGWTNTGELSNAMYVYDLLEAYDGTIYAATVPNGDVFKTTDGGTTWQNTLDLPGAIMAFCLIQAQDSAIYCGTYPNGDVFKTTDAGNTWMNTADIPNATTVRSLLQTRDGKILAGCFTGKTMVYATTNGGQTWDSLATIPFIGNGVFCLYQAFNNTLLFAGAWGFPGVSTNGGRTWIPMNDFPFPGEHRSINFIKQISDSTLWCGGWIHGHGGYVFKSTDRGMTWDSTARIMRGPVHAVRVYDLLELDDGSMLIGFQPAKDTVCFRTTDMGQTWQFTGTMSDAYNVLCFLKTRSGDIYAGTTPNGDVFKYTSVPIKEENKSIYGNELKISPNPTRGKLTISSTLLKYPDAWLKIYNSIGELIKEVSPNGKENFTVSLSEKGILFIVVETQTQKIRKKLIIFQ